MREVLFFGGPLDGEIHLLAGDFTIGDSVAMRFYPDTNYPEAFTYYHYTIQEQDGQLVGINDSNSN